MPDTSEKYSPFWFRMLEILPGFLVWVSLLAPIFLSLAYPLAVTLFILVFDIYWLVQTFNYGYLLVRGYRRMKYNLRVNWTKRLKELSDLSPEERAEKDILDPKELYQAVILTTYKEEKNILEASIDSIVTSNYPNERLILVLATEERDKENVRGIARELKEKYKDKFFLFISTEHPDGIVGEVKAKGANATWAAKKLVEEITAHNIPYDRVIVSAADADTRFDNVYFSCLTYAYAVRADRIHCSFQPISTYFNNIWQAPMISRVLAFGTTFFQLVQSVRDYRLVSFSTHATSLQTLLDIDYWCTTIVNEDSRQYFRSFFHYNGDFRVVPLFVPIYMDAVHVHNFIKTAKNLYFQQQRWAYGVEHFPYIAMESFRRKSIPLIDRIMITWRSFHGSYSWATSSFFIIFVGWLPILLNNNFRDAVVVSNFIVATKFILGLTWIGLVISGAITIRILTIVPHKKGPYEWATMIIQWILVPTVGIFFGAVPGLDAITRLMLGKYLGFRVTEKAHHEPQAI